MFDADTVSLKKQRASQGAQRWELSFSTVPTDSDIADNFVASVKDFHLPDSMIMPQFKEVLNRYTFVGDILTSNSSAAGDEDATLSNNSGQSGIIPKGYFIKFANHDKVYLVTEDINLDGNTNKNLKLYPALVKAVPSQTQVMVEDNCTIAFFRSLDSQRGITFSDGIMVNSGVITLEEAI
jgi:hypothetical protein